VTTLFYVLFSVTATLFLLAALSRGRIQDKTRSNAVFVLGIMTATGVLAIVAKQGSDPSGSPMLLDWLGMSAALFMIISWATFSLDRQRFEPTPGMIRDEIQCSPDTSWDRRDWHGFGRSVLMTTLLIVLVMI